MKNSWFGIRIIIFLLVITITASCETLSKAGIDSDTVFSTIALILFIGMMMYYLLPKPMGRRHGKVTSTHKQYNDNRFTDFVMGKIMKAYNVKEESEDASEESEYGDGLDKLANGESDKRHFEESPSARIDKATNRERYEKFEKRIENEGSKKIKPRKYNDSLLTDYMMEKIMKAYNVPKELEPDDEDESDFNEFEENYESSPDWIDQQPQFDSDEIEEIKAEEKFFKRIWLFLEIISLLWLLGISIAETKLPGIASFFADKIFLMALIMITPVVLLTLAMIVQILGSRTESLMSRIFTIIRGVFDLLILYWFIASRLSNLN
ncbi:MAG: hypothetical protein HY865_25560 [Chloroflexi bacterium]|nr:hypothetical protein [Chloroflexota bacterium]